MHIESSFTMRGNYSHHQPLHPHTLNPFDHPQQRLDNQGRCHHFKAAFGRRPCLYSKVYELMGSGFHVSLLIPPVRQPGDSDVPPLGFLVEL